MPHLAGQQRAYLELQIKAFRAQKRRDPDAHSMWEVAATWLEDDKLRAEIADYFFFQPPVPRKSGDPTIVALGRELYEKPSSERSVPNCAGCHGAKGEGMSVFPRLASQQAQYLTRQMLRVGRRDASQTHAAIKGLSNDEIAALAAYLQSE